MATSSDPWNDYIVIEYLVVVEKPPTTFGPCLEWSASFTKPDLYQVEICFWRGDNRSRHPTLWIRAHSPLGSRITPRRAGASLGIARREAARLAGVLAGHRRDGRWVVELRDVEARTMIMGHDREFVEMDGCWQHAERRR